MTEWQSISVLLTNTARHSALSLVAATSLYSQRRLERPTLLLVPPRQSFQPFPHLWARAVATQPPAAVHGDGLGCDVLAHTDEENRHRALERSALRNDLIKSTQVLDMCKQEECLSGARSHPAERDVGGDRDAVGAELAGRRRLPLPGALLQVRRRVSDGALPNQRMRSAEEAKRESDECLRGRRCRL